MRNGNKALVIAGAILLAILVIVAGMFIYNTAVSSATQALSQYPAEEATAFNSQYEVFMGKQKGSGLGNLVKKLIITANTNKDNLDKIPALTITNQINKSATKVDNVEKPGDASEITAYVKALTGILNLIEEKHEYSIEIKYGTNGLISEFAVTY